MQVSLCMVHQDLVCTVWLVETDEVKRALQIIEAADVLRDQKNFDFY